MFARGTYRIDSARGAREFTIEEAVPYLYFGVAGQMGVTETAAGEVATTAAGAGFVGTRFLAITGGYDFLNATPFIGLSANVTGTSLLPRASLVFSTWR